MDRGGNYGQNNYSYNQHNDRPIQLSMPSEEKTSDGLALASLIIGIISLIGACCFGGFLGVASLILGIIALANRYCNRRGMAIVGIILSTLAFMITIIVLILGIANSKDTSNISNLIEQTTSTIEKDSETEVDKDIDVNKEDITNDVQPVVETDKYANISYEDVNIASLQTELENNALRAETAYQDKYVQLKCVLAGIDSDGSYITVKAYGDDSWWPFTLQCFLTESEQEDILLKLEIGDDLIIRGQITQIGEVVGYLVDIHTILYDPNKVVAEDKSYATSGGLGKEYKIVSFDDLYSQLETNALKAERTWQDQYIQVTGKLANIDSDGAYISIESTLDKYSFNTIQCYIKNDKQLNTVMNLNIGDTITVKGKITTVGELIGYYVDLDSIER